jgi:hypothetical protein
MAFLEMVEGWMKRREGEVRGIYTRQDLIHLNGPG